MQRAAEHALVAAAERQAVLRAPAARVGGEEGAVGRRADDDGEMRMAGAQRADQGGVLRVGDRAVNGDERCVDVAAGEGAQMRRALGFSDGAAGDLGEQIAKAAGSGANRATRGQAGAATVWSLLAPGAVW